MTMTTNLTDPAAVEAVRLAPCGHCWRPRPGEPCTPGGSHFARWARARRKGLITAEQAAAALDLLPVITNDAIVPDPGPAGALAALGARPTGSAPSALPAGS
jgi:hypothetical protein